MKLKSTPSLQPTPSQTCKPTYQAILHEEKSPGVSQIYKQHITLIGRDKQPSRKVAKGYEFTEEEIDRPTDRGEALSLPGNQGNAN